MGAGCSDKLPDALCTGEMNAASSNLRVLDTECSRGVAIETLTECLATAGPDACARNVPFTLCDSDGDGVSDDLETALTRAYAPAFAFNGGNFGGNPETHWPANAQFFVSHAKLTYGRSRTVIDATPTLEALGAAANDSQRADDPCGGSEFWLCLGDSSNETRVTSAAMMLALPGGIDVLSVVHPSNGMLAGSTHIFVSYSLIFPFNAHSTVDDHEGDWEGIAVFVNRATGAVDAGWFERHNTEDNERLIANEKYAPRDPAVEQPYGTLATAFGAVHGLRFYDHGNEPSARRHVVAYVATGGHAMYDYPADTRIMKLGPRDTHSGDGPKLIPWSSRLVSSYGATTGDPLEVAYVNPGEPHKITLPWARFRGQWGCTDQPIAKSWPGPFGNARHPRPMFERVWGSPLTAP